MLNEKEFLEKCLEDYNNKSKKVMKSHEEIKVIFDDIKKRIKKLGDKIK
jgi:hypothetical protein